MSEISGSNGKNIGVITINGQEYDIYIAKSEKQKQKGLQGFNSLPLDEGMLFVLNEKEPTESWFHMKNVGMPLDLVFMDEDFKVLSVKQGKPNDPTPIEGIGAYVLEVNAGSNIKEGDEADLEDDETNEYVMKVLGTSGEPQGHLFGGERIVSRKETKVLIRKALKAYTSKEDKDYKALGKYMFKVLKGQNERPAEYVESPKNKEN